MNYGPCERCKEGPFSGIDKSDERCGVAFATMHRTEPEKQFSGDFCTRCVRELDGVFIGMDGFDLVNKERFLKVYDEIFEDARSKAREKSCGSGKARRRMARGWRGVHG